MKNKLEVLEFETIILRKEMSKPKWYEGFCNQPNASKMKLRLAEKTLHRNTIKDLMDHFGYEKMVDPVDAMYRKKRMRKWLVSNEDNTDKIKAETKDEAKQLFAKSIYGDKTIKDYKGREKFVWELALCDITADEVI